MSASSQVGSQVVHMLLNVVSSLVIIRYLPPSSYGDYVLVMTMMTVTGLVADFGLNKLGVRDVAAHESDEPEVVGTVIALRLGLAVVAAGVFQAVLLGLGRSAEVHTAAALASLTFVASALMSVVISFEVRLQQHIPAFTLLLGEIIETGLVLWLVRHHGSLSQLYGAAALGTGVAAAVAVVLARRRLVLRPRFDASRMAPLIRGALPLAAASLVGIVLIKLDTFVLVLLRPRREVGLYGAAYAPVEYLAVAAVVLVSVLLPLLARYHVTDRARFVAVYRLGTEALLAFVLPMAVLLAVVAGPAIDVVYSGQYRGATTPMRLLGFGLVVMSLSAWYAIVLLAVGQQHLIVRYTAAMLGVAAVVHPVLIAWLGATGAALGVLAVGLLTAAWAGRLVRRMTDARVDVSRVARVVGAGAAIGVVAVGLDVAGVGVWPAAACGALVYVPTLFLLGVAPRDLASLLRTTDDGVTLAEATA
ncbi:MAG: oligosaccharide flippase family protein [Acidimicrobiia bacterium]|nr:oligosaccharide flippase family protein [Acidimicrobiia bacterium]